MLRASNPTPLTLSALGYVAADRHPPLAGNVLIFEPQLEAPPFLPAGIADLDGGGLVLAEPGHPAMRLLLDRAGIRLALLVQSFNRSYDAKGRTCLGAWSVTTNHTESCARA